MQEQAVYGYEFEGTRYDAGTTMGWLKASVELALERPDLAPEFRRLPPGARALTTVQTRVASPATAGRTEPYGTMRTARRRRGRPTPAAARRRTGGRDA